MKFFLTKKAWQNEVNSIKEPLQSSIKDKELMIQLVEKSYNVELHNKDTSETITALFVSKNDIYWNGYEDGFDIGARAALHVILGDKTPCTTVDDIVKKIKEFAHETIVEARKDTEEKIRHRKEQ